MPLNCRRALDVGCGQGQIARPLARPIARRRSRSISITIPSPGMPIVPRPASRLVYPLPSRGYMSLIAEENAGHARRRRLIESLIETMGSLLGIARCTVPRTPMEPLSHARVTIAGGGDGDLRGKPGPRQVTIIADSSWSDACAE